MSIVTQRSFEIAEKSLSRLCVHTVTTKPWPIERAIVEYSNRGIGGISIWRDAIAGRDLTQVRAQLLSHQLEPVSLVRAGFFPSQCKEDRIRAQNINREALREAAQLGCSQLVLVCGADPRLSIHENLNQITEGIRELLITAQELNVKLSIEPLHPMYADTRSAIALLKTANDICGALNHPYCGIAIDVFHVWWDPDLRREMQRTAKANRFFAYHLCDWKLNMTDMLNDRGLMGEGIIPLAEMTEMTQSVGYEGYHEVEIFSNHWWSTDQAKFLDLIIKSYFEVC